MPTDLELHLREIRVVDTHEHLAFENEWVEHGPADILADLFEQYPNKDLVSAGIGPDQIAPVLKSEGDLESRWRAIEPGWRCMQFTGYGEAVRIVAREVYGIEEITAESLRSAQPRLTRLRQPGQRYRLLKDLCRYDHVQINSYLFPETPDRSDPAFFMYDLSWAVPSAGRLPEHFASLGIEVRNLTTLGYAMAAYFQKHQARAIAVKTQHAYERTLRWEERSDTDAERALAAVLANKAESSDRLCLGDWCLARGIEQAIRYDLPVKIHTGYYWNNNVMVTDRIRPGHLCPLLIRYPQARFVLMHAGYPYGHEIPALAKHFGNVYADLCWAWSMDPYMTMDVFRHYLHAAPLNKLFAFGGDTRTPTVSYGYLLQMRKWLARALQAEIAQGDLSERQAIEIVELVLRENALKCFGVREKQAVVSAAAGVLVGT